MRVETEFSNYYIFLKYLYLFNVYYYAVIQEYRKGCYEE